MYRREACSMAKKQMAAPAKAQRIYEKVLGIGAVLWMMYHMAFTFFRHLVAAENNIGASRLAMGLLNGERWFGLALMIAAVGYLVFTAVKYPRSMGRVKDFLGRLRCREMVLLLGLVGYYLLVLMVHAGRYSNIFPTNDIYLMDLMISVGLLFAMPLVLGKNAKKMVDGVLHAIMLLSTGFIVWALWQLFHLNIVQLPNGLQLGMTSKAAFYAGVNENIGAAIGTAMVMICLYMIASQRWPLKIVYGAALIPHTVATLLTHSRSAFLALWIAFSLTVFMLVWNRMEKRNLPVRILVAGAGLAAMAVLFYFVRGWVFGGFESITHFQELLHANTQEAGSEAAAGAAVQESFALDSARIRIWRSSVSALFSSPRTFFFGVPGGLIPQTIQETMKSLYGHGSLFAHAHNILLQVGLMLGVPGLVGFVAFLVMLFLRCVRVVFGKGKAQVRGGYVLPIAILSLLAVNMFEPFLMFYLSVMGSLFFLYAGWVIAMDRGDVQ